MARRLIEASHVIAFQDGGHRHLRDGVVVTDGSDIVHVGPRGSWNQPVDETIDASGMVVTPGFINTHTHLYESPLDKSFVEDMGRRQFYLSGLFEYLPVRSVGMDEEAGLRAMDRAVRFIEEHDGEQNGRIKGFLSPAQVDTCTEELLRRSREAASSMGVPLALHTSQSVNEFLEMTRRHGLTPIEWLREIGFLGPDDILGHAIIVAPGSW